MRQTRRWQIAFAALMVMVLGVGVPVARQGLMIARAKNIPSQPGVIASVSPPPAETHPTIRRRADDVGLTSFDAWQVQTEHGKEFERQLARFKQMNAASQSLVVGAMTRDLDRTP